MTARKQKEKEFKSREQGEKKKQRDTRPQLQASTP
jgi:hypothetical protein